MHTATNLAGEKLVVLTAAEYLALAEDAIDAAAMDDARHADRDAPTLDGDTVGALIRGEMHPLTAWRKAAGLSQVALGRLVGMRTATISGIETGKTDPRVSTMQSIARALRVDVQDILP